MSSLEEYIYSTVIGSTNIKAQLATYSNAPALFESQAPDDTDKGWKGAQYPRMDYVVDRQEDPARKVSGMVIFDIWCLNTQDIGPEAIEAEARALLDGTVFHPGDEPVTALKWNRSEPFTQDRGDQKDGLIIGITMAFDLLAFPAQVTTEPDPIAAMNKWSVDTFNSLQVDPETWDPTDNTPAVYWRLSGLSVAQQLNSVTWMDAQLAGHIITGGPSDRLTWTKKLAEGIAMAGHIYMLDTSPMFIQKVNADSSGDPYREGQLKITVRYGILKQPGTCEPLNHPNVEGILTTPADAIAVIEYQAGVNIAPDSHDTTKEYPAAGTINTSGSTLM